VNRAESHTPVLVEEVLQWLEIKPDGIYVDATLGAGGHSAAIAQRLVSGNPEGPGRLISLDRDERALELARENLKPWKDRVTLVKSPFSRIAEVVQELGIPKVDGVLADLGVSSMQLDQSARGFSFREAGPLDMRMDAEGELTADEIVNQWSEKEIADLLYQTFLALRIAVNREMEELGQFLSRTPATINPGGRWVVLSYHSREDRLVKHAFQEGQRAGTLRVLTRHVIQPSEAEQANNPRSRSAKLRCAEMVAAA
jgi:16S rRNA (cytosine1402-N4)-methyltransferase